MTKSPLPPDAPVDAERWPKRNDLISGKRWKMTGVGSITSFDTIQNYENGPWMVEFMSAKTMVHNVMLVDTFLDNVTPIPSWSGVVPDE